jgi:hypothetical protein
MELRENEGLDLPPEFCRYPDEGCEFSESCLNCHLPMCVFEEVGGRRRLLQDRRAEEMARLAVAEAKGTRELAELYGVSQRTVQRALRKAAKHAATREARHD